MQKILTFGNIASAVTFLAAGFAIGIVMGNRQSYESGVRAGSGDLAIAYDALEKYGEIVNQAPVLDQYDKDSRELIQSIISEVEDKNFSRAQDLMRSELTLLNKDGCKGNGDVFKVSNTSPSFRNCETDQVALFSIKGTAYVNVTFGAELKSLSPGQPKTWDLGGNETCTIAVAAIGQDGGEVVANTIFQGCGGS
ncbi:MULTISPECIES: hypothetical protein [unclassified Roseovarius]|uniref:hypothetical protein n=1 Tax=unclassified Roseovarius TaxID=2614913 RepID=UPI00273ED61A|nr:MULTISPECIES: hypothetical protein [unclassified Roseovarius]